MFNIEMERNGDVLVIRIDLTKNAGSARADGVR